MYTRVAIFGPDVFLGNAHTTIKFLKMVEELEKEQNIVIGQITKDIITQSCVHYILVNYYTRAYKSSLNYFKGLWHYGENENSQIINSHLGC